MKKPNIVFILSDQHNAEVMGCAGDPYIKTPNLNALAQEGIRLSNCCCNAPLCVPSRMSLMSGQLPLESQSMNNFQSLYSDIPTMAHSINNAGYETVLAGRMHFSGPDQLHGYEQRLVGDVTPIYHGYDTFSEVLESYEGAFKQQRVTLQKSGPGHCAIEDYDREVAQAVRTFLEHRTDSRPLFLTVGFASPHPPFITDSDRFRYYYDLLPEIQTPPEFEKNLHPAIRTWRQRRNIDKVPPQEKRISRAAYYAMVEFTDQMVGQVIQAVRQTLGENTIVVYASDHGECMGINDMWWKGTFYEGALKVPVIVSMPGTLPQGETLSDPTCLLDLTATFLDYAEAEPLPDMYGQSLSRVLAGEEHISQERTIISELGNYPPAGDSASAMIKKGKYKLISYYGYDAVQLFDLEKDPAEIYNLGSDPQYAQVREELLSELNQKWDEKAAYEYCQRAFQWFKIQAKWANNTHGKIPDYWKCKPGVNRLETIE